MNFDEMKKWYDGYVLNDYHIYNPKSVVDSLRSKIFDSYWTSTETYEALKIYMNLNYDGLKEKIVKLVSGEKIKIKTISFQNDMTTIKSRDDVLTLLVHLGYLAYDNERKEVYIPNQEVADEFRNSVEYSNWEGVSAALEASDRLLDATLRMDADQVAEEMDKAHMENTSILTYNNELSLSCVIAIAYYTARRDYTMIRELPSGKGFADIAFVPRRHSSKPAFIVELKWDQSSAGAVSQIRSKQYEGALAEYKNNLLLVGINYNRKNKRHECVIEKFQ